MKGLSIFTLLMIVCAASLLHGETPRPDDAQTLQQYIEKKFPQHRFKAWIYVSIRESKLLLICNGQIVKTYPISSSKNGLGNILGSNKTPLGLHKIQKKFGEGLPQNAILKGRIYTGETATVIQDPIATDDDYITSRILWLSGLEPGYNQGDSVDSFNRYIYIHGTTEEGLIGTPASHGCIRMKNKDVIELFDLAPEGMKVFIE